MISTTPYLIRAIYEWCSDQGFTPHLLVDASEEGVLVPRALVENDVIVLNIQASAVKLLELGDEWIMFKARFSGNPMEVVVPITAVRAVFAKENGMGCAFEASEMLSAEQAAEAMEELDLDLKDGPPSAAQKKTTSPTKSHLKLVD